MAKAAKRRCVENKRGGNRKISEKLSALGNGARKIGGSAKRKTWRQRGGGVISSINKYGVIGKTGGNRNVARQPKAASLPPSRVPYSSARRAARRRASALRRANALRAARCAAQHQRSGIMATAAASGVASA
jgi:hypothetical protein